jgi:hypothetical protein
MPKKPQPLAKIQSSESQTYAGIQQLLDSETGLIAYSSEIVRKFYTKMELHNLMIKKGGNLLEFGAGTGSLAEIFRTKFNLNPDCLELDLIGMSLENYSLETVKMFYADAKQAGYQI